MNALKHPAIAAVLDAEGVAAVLGLKSADAFYSRRAALEAAGFPARLPGLPRWSRACVLRWIETNGATCQPAPAGETVAFGEFTSALLPSLEEVYANG